jgi:hypothetical protein
MNTRTYYHPNRFYYSRSYIKSLLPKFKDKFISNPKSEKVVDALFNDFIPIHNSMLSELPIELRPKDFSVATHEASLFMHYATYHAAGRNIFHFQPALTELFRHTDVEDVVVDNIKLPYSSFYISFGIQKDLNLWSQGFYVDGAYISAFTHNADQIFEILLTTARTDLDYSQKQNYIIHPDRYYYFTLDFSEKDKSVRDAINASVTKHKPFTPIDIPDRSGVHKIGDHEVFVLDRGKESQAIQTKERQSGFSIFLESIKLIINGLFYLTSQHREVILRYPQDTPVSLLKKFDGEHKQLEIERAANKLTSMGFTKIHFCGDSIQAENDSLPTGRKMATHWRRGHWRNQPHGSHYSEHKLIWIKPTLVRKDKGDPSSGHIYDVSESKT